jgi:hypothetical protein
LIVASSSNLEHPCGEQPYQHRDLEQFRLVCLLAEEYQSRNISRFDGTLFNLSPAKLYAPTITTNSSKSTHSWSRDPILPLSSSTTETGTGTGLTAFQAGAELAKAFKVALERLMDLDIGFPCLQESIEDEVELLSGQAHEVELERGDLVKGCLALCLYIVSS